MTVTRYPWFPVHSRARHRADVPVVLNAAQVLYTPEKVAEFESPRVCLKLPPLVRDACDVEAEIHDRMVHGIREARGHLEAGRRGRALFVLVRSLSDQARVAGLRVDLTQGELR